MKKIRWAMTARYMLRQKSACLSMFIVAMLAVTAYLGISFTAAAMRDNADRYWSRTAFRDIEIVSPSLLSEDDLRAISDTAGVKDVEAVWYTEASAVSRQKTGVDVVSLTERINTVRLTEGRMPETAEECLLEAPVLEALGLSMGDTLELEPNPMLARTRFTVCGVAEHADHPCTTLNVPGNRYAVVMPDAFALESLQGHCMKAVVRVEETEGASRFSEDYLAQCGRVCSRLNSLSEEIAFRQISPETEDGFLVPFLKLALAGLGGVYPWLVLDVWGSSSYYAIRVAAENAANIGVTFAAAFVVVGALVIFASISRMAEEDRKRIGTEKAMGMTGKEIAFKYLAAGTIPTTAGMLAGIAAGYAAIQPIVLSIYGKLYIYGSGMPAFRPTMTAAVLAAGILIAAAAALTACAGLLRAPAVRLMNERPPASRFLERAGRRGTQGAAGRSLSARLVFRSLWSEKRRALVIVAGIAGCVILLVTGFTIRLAVSETLDRQFADVETYDLKVVFDREGEDGGLAAEAQVISLLNEEGIPKGTGQTGWIEVSVRDCYFAAGGRMNGGELICGKPEELPAYFRMRDVRSGGEMALTSEPGLYIHLRTAETAGLAPGDRLTLYDLKMNRVRVPIAGVFNNYIGGQMLMSESAYEAVYKSAPEKNCFLVRCGGARSAALAEKLSALPVSVTTSAEKQEEYKSYTSALDLIAGLLAGIAALMAGGVLLNLIYLQYYRKKRSLVIMRINGFTTGETAGYVLGESAVTHALGIVLGVVGGTWFGRRIICLMEGRQLHIVRAAQPLAWLISAAVMLLFSAAIHAVVVRAVMRLKPTEDVMIR